MVFKERTFYGETPHETALPSSADLESRVADMLAVANGLDAVNINVTAEDSTIVLTGYVQTQDEIGRVTEAVMSVEGVSDVVNRVIASDDATNRH